MSYTSLLAVTPSETTCKVCRQRFYFVRCSPATRKIVRAGITDMYGVADQVRRISTSFDKGQSVALLVGFREAERSHRLVQLLIEVSRMRIIQMSNYVRTFEGTQDDLYDLTNVFKCTYSVPGLRKFVYATHQITKEL